MTRFLMICDTHDEFQAIFEQIKDSKEYCFKECRYENCHDTGFQEFDIIILYFNERRMKNSEFKHIFNVKCKTKTPVLIIFESSTTRDKLNALNFGAEDYLDMPVTYQHLQDKITHLARLNRVLTKLHLERR